MSLQIWAGNAWLRPPQYPAPTNHRSSRHRRTRPQDASGDISVDWQFPGGADYPDSCRSKRNTAESDAAGTISKPEARELREFTRQLHQQVLAWLQKNHFRLSPCGFIPYP